MGKNAAFKAQQASRHAAGDEAPVAADPGDGLVDASFHTAEWHAARLAALQVERPSFEEWQRKQKEEQNKMDRLAGDEEKLMQDYRARLAADRARRLGLKEPSAEDKSRKRKRKDKDKDKKSSKDKSKKRKKEKKEKHSKDKHKHRKHKKHKRRSSSGSSGSSSDSDSSSSDDDKDAGSKPDGPIRLSEFFKS